MKKSLIGILSTIAGVITGYIVTDTVKRKKNKENQEKILKFKNYYNLLNQWLILKNEGKHLQQYFINNGYKTIAIYGMGEMGKRLYEELHGSSVEILYAIDKNADSIYSELEIYNSNDELKQVDAIIVSSIFAFNEIEEELSNKVDFPIISLEDIIFEL